MLYNEKFKDEFDYIKWYPHVKIIANNLTGNINNERVRSSYRKFTSNIKGS